MKFFKRPLFICLVLLFAVFVCREWIFGKLITYRSVSLRKIFFVKNKKLIDQIEKKRNNALGSDIRKITLLALEITSEELCFSFESNITNPNLLIGSKRTHYIGYASFFTTTCNYLLLKQNLNDKWIVNHHRGKLYFLGIDIHHFINSSFFSDHDFVTLENKDTGEIIAVDPSLHDFLYIDYITYQSK